MTHSIIPPSSAGAWGALDGCTGWVLMNQMYPELEPTQESLEGEASHEVGEGMISDAKTNAQRRHEPRDWVGITASNGVVITDEMFEGAKLYADDVINEMRTRGIFGGEHLGIEQRIEAKRIHELSFGTADFFLFDKKTGELIIYDYKFGMGVVEAFENWQLINYVCGILDMIGIQGDQDEHITVRMRVAQPRAFHRDGAIREWKVRASELRGYFNILSHNAHVALGPNAEYKTGPQCRYCPGRHACPAALKAGINLYEVSTAPTPVEMSPEAMGLQYSLIQRAIKQLEYLETGFEEQIKALIRSGVNVPGFSVAPSYGRKAWTKPVEEIIALGDMLEKDFRKPTAITPLQAIELGVDESVIKAYSDTPTKGIKIVPDNGSKAKHVFGA